MSKVYIGIGHGGSDPGAVSGSFKESVFALDIGCACTAELRRHGISVKQSRITEKTHGLQDKINDCNNYNPVVAIDIHLNAGNGDGFEVFHSINSSKGKKFAECLEARVKQLNQQSRGVKTRKNAKGKDYFGFVRQVKCPSLLVECAFIDNKEDVKLVDTIKERIVFGKALAWGILDYLGIKIKEEKVTEKPVSLNKKVRRIAGANRVKTAIEIANTGWAKAKNAILVSGNNYADALVSVPFSYAVDAPILLNTKDYLEKENVELLKALSVEKVYIIGGEKAINSFIETDLKNDYTVERIFGKTRFETSIEVAKKLQEITGNRSKTAYGVSAESFADALSVSVGAAIGESPIIYLPTKGEIFDNIKDYLINIHSEIIVVGGNKVIADEITGQLAMFGLAVDRISGANRYETCLKVNNYFDEKDFYAYQGLGFATGKNYPDALAAAAWCTVEGIPIVLIDDGADTKELLEFISWRDGEDVFVFGGEAVLSNKIVNKFVK